MKNVSQLYNIAQIELIYHHNSIPVDYPKVNNALTAYQILRSSWDDNKIDLYEQFKIILLDRSKACLGVVEIADGGFNQVTVDPKSVFAAALIGKASSIILAHNHTTDRLDPSADDLNLTKHLITCGMVMDIDIDDHLILNRRRFHSMKDAHFIL